MAYIFQSQFSAAELIFASSFLFSLFTLVTALSYLLSLQPFFLSQMSIPHSIEANPDLHRAQLASWKFEIKNISESSELARLQVVLPNDTIFHTLQYQYNIKQKTKSTINFLTAQSPVKRLLAAFSEPSSRRDVTSSTNQGPILRAGPARSDIAW